LAADLGVVRITASTEHARIEFNETPNINSAKLIQLIQTESKQHQLDGPNKLKLIFEKHSAEARIEAIQALLLRLMTK